MKDLVIYEWMLKYGFKTTELIAFAFLYDYRSYSGSVIEIAKVCGITRQNIYPVLKKLIRKGFIYIHKDYLSGACKTVYIVNQEKLK